MAKDLGLTVNIKVGISEDLAVTCLKLVQSYCNDNNKSIRIAQKNDGCIELSFADQTPQKRW